MVSQVAKEQDTYADHFRRLQEGGGPTWLARLREEAFTRFRELGLPTTRHEEWKYTNVAPIARAGFEPAAVGTEAPAKGEAEWLGRLTYEESAGSRLVFLNGSFRPELSSTESLPEGVVAADIGGALAGPHAEVLRERLARTADYGANAFAALNTALLSGGAFLLVPKGVRVDSPVQLLFVSDPGAAETFSSPRVLLVCDEGAEATVIESYAGANERGVYFTNAVTEVVLGAGARMDYYKVQREGAGSYHVASTHASLGRDSNFGSTAITLGAALSRHDVWVSLDSEGAECRVDGLYVVGDGQHADTHSVIDHKVPRCTSRQLYKGILDGKSRAVFNGKVFVREGAQQTDAQQANKNLLLSEDARVDTKPQLEIFADDVKCAHGATVGQLEEEELFYLLSRGLHPDLARNLLTYGFAEEVIDRVRVDSIKAELDEAVLNRLHARLEA